MRTGSQKKIEIPVVIVGDFSWSFSHIQIGIEKASHGKLRRAISLDHAFKAVSEAHLGIIICTLDSVKSMHDFFATLKAYGASLAVERTRIFVLAKNTRVLDDPTLRQLGLVLVYPVSIETRDLTHMLINEVNLIEQRSLGNASEDGAMVVRAPARDLPAKKADGNAWLDLSSTESRQDLLREMTSDNVQSIIYSPDLRWSVHGHFAAYDQVADLLVFEAANLASANRLIEAFSENRSGFLGSSDLLRTRILCTLELRDIDGRRCAFQAPKKIFGVQRRFRLRMKVRSKTMILLEGVIPGKLEKKSEKFMLSVQDLALDGAGAFVDESQRASFQKGMVLENLTLRLRDKKVLIPRAEIRHISHAEGSSSHFQVGLQFEGLSALDSTLIEYFILTQSIRNSSK